MNKEIGICIGGPIEHYLQICMRVKDNLNEKDAIKQFYESCYKGNQIAIDLLIAESIYRLNREIEKSLDCLCEAVQRLEQ